jgi:hypothetical protein
MNKMMRKYLRWAFIVISASGLYGAKPDLTDAKHRAVLDLNPSGYWPADEGSGEILNDRSGSGKHGRLFHVPWKNGLLDFTSAFQWAEIPGHTEYQSGAFTIGGWLFIRRNDYVSGGGQAGGMYFFGNTFPPRPWPSDAMGCGLSIGAVDGGLNVAVRSGGKNDVLGSMSGRISLESGTWQHVIYTFDAGTGQLYVNGQLAIEKSGVPFNPEYQKRAFFVGADATWWMVHPPPARSLDGSVKDLVIFDRALTTEEVARLCEATRPATAPAVYPEGSVRLDAKTIPLEELPLCSLEERLRALEQVEKRKPTEIYRTADVLLPVLKQGLTDWPTRRVAASLLATLNTTESLAVLQEALPELIGIVGNTQASPQDRASAALALAEMKMDAGAALPVLTQSLETIVKNEGIRMPRVEDLVRNALIRSLHAVAPDDPAVRDLLGRALPAGDGGNYFSQGDRCRDERAATGTDRAYTPAAVKNEVRYSIGDAIPFNSADPVSAEEFAKIVSLEASSYSAVKSWRKDESHLYRLKIDKTGPDGMSETAFLESESFMFDGSDSKLRGWSVAIDKDGYIHLTGGQHNSPNPDHFIPGSWEKMGVSRDRIATDFPRQMYWVSEKPGDITSFKFAGQKNNPRSIPADYLNYMNFVQDQNGELYVYGRISVNGWQSWGLYCYDVGAKQWNVIGGDACNIIADAKKQHPGWTDYLIKNIRGALPVSPGPKALAWAWQPHFYNYCRASRGIQFDRTNRMHVQVPLRGLDGEGRIADYDLYAWSDDEGKTFHRADGSVVELPLTVNPAPEHTTGGTLWLDLWLSVLKTAGYQVN